MKRRLILLMAAAVPLSAALVPMAASGVTRDGGTGAATTCSAMPVSAPPGTTVESVRAVAQAGGTVTFPDATPLPTPPPITDVPARCDVTVTLTHPGANDHVTVKVSLPQDPQRWTGRFQATGGSAYLAGDFGAPLVTAVKNGYVAAATDAGVGQNPVDVSGWALTPAGTVNTPLLKNFASRSLHDMAVVGKDVARKFYGTAVRYSYWNGCSTGGRQGYLEAQDHPTDFQGVLATAPAINWDRFAVATLWPQVVFHEEKVQPTQCELEAFTAAAVKACDPLDGVADGVIDNPQDCHWDARRLIGTTVVCDGRTITISAATADAVRKIWAGPVSPTGQKLWYGPNKGASFSWLAVVGVPFTVADSWVRYFVKQDPSFATTTMTYRTFAQIFRQSQRQYNDIIGTDDPDLSAFAKAGGKLLSWHGQADELVPTQGTVDYRERVNRVFGGNKRVDDFYRLFLLPGVAHCGGGTGLQPTDELGTLVNWVEKGQAPATLATSSTDGSVSRNACRYPQAARYTGHGDPALAANHRCVPA
ncbi:tannase/feruloyl esterase family alpha/beta hydrolase [Micromonospora sp. RHAY321]|uniref:tannase/feruloyl esterase family alpha/beta hydrolase n=1 Tax=Micromonospora sp. RHAY321 TaxID=2944807 RepID=UPI00207D4F03|nr:tannase/feruloyl esterase family alpha/beta hydrolase [Micromonospora sp. RHAY321]MCO1594553.1 tannase/feruloyl esterase family alpha/beta hydrolase [Micromonospora sp. RHAY321]